MGREPCGPREGVPKRCAGEWWHVRERRYFHRVARLTDQELMAFSEHLLYDIQLFFHEARVLTRARLELSLTLVWEVEMALVESFALHARSLVDFLFRDKGRSDDAFAAHFFEPGEAELMVEGWPLSFIQAQLGIKTLYAMDRFLKHLDIGPPDPEDVVTIIQTRSWDIAA